MAERGPSLFGANQYYREEAQKKKRQEMMMDLIMEGIKTGNMAPDQAEGLMSQGADGKFSLGGSTNPWTTKEERKAEKGEGPLFERDKSGKWVQLPPEVNRKEQIVPFADTGEDSRFSRELQQKKELKEAELAQQKSLAEEKAVLQRELEGERAKKDFRKQMQTVSSDKKKDKNVRALATQAIQMLDETDEIPQLTNEQYKAWGIVPSTRPAYKAKSKDSPDGNDEQPVTDYLKQIGAKDTPANRKWAKDKIGK